MKKIMLIMAAGTLFLSACAQKEEKREETKQELSAEHMRNEGVDSAAVSAEPSAATDEVVKDSAK